jgi:hypothetical protein
MMGSPVYAERSLLARHLVIYFQGLDAVHAGGVVFD